MTDLADNGRAMRAKEVVRDTLKRARLLVELDPAMKVYEDAPVARDGVNLLVQVAGLDRPHMVRPCDMLR